MYGKETDAANVNKPSRFRRAFNRSVSYESSTSNSSDSVASSTMRVEDTEKKGPDEKIYSISEDSFDNAFEACSLTSDSEYRTLNKKDIDQFHDHIIARPLDEAITIIKNAIEEHTGDPCLSHDKLESLNGLIEKIESKRGDMCTEYTVKFEAFLINDWSIYSEVRAVTRPLDEEGENYETFRVYVIGTVWACLGAAMDTFFATRYPSISLDSGSILIMVVYSGKLFAKLPPLYIPWFGNKKFYINPPTPWSFKEQMLATLAMSVSVSSPYALRAIVSQSNPHFLGIDAARGFGYIFMLILSSNFMGFGIAGIMRTFLVYPTRCVWYNVLPTIAVNRALISPETRASVNGWRLKGAEFFGIIVLVSFIWYWVTNYLFQALSFFDWPAWIAPRNVHLQSITGCINGLSFNPINTFDWNNIGSAAIITPLFAQTMKATGMFLSMFALIAIWYTNTSWTAYMPINTTQLYANDGKPYQATKILKIPGYILSEEMYQKYSPPFWSAGSLTNEGANLLMYTGMIVYTMLNYGRPVTASVKLFWTSVIQGWKKKGSGGSLKSFKDRFSRAQWKYKEVPEWWFFGVMVASIAVGIAMVEYYAFTSTPVWTIFFAIGISVVFSIPFGYLYASTSISFDINTLFEIIIGLALPGNANALMVSKVFASNFFSQSANYITNQVQAHYTGIAPRALFRAQMVSVMASVVVKSLLSYWVVSPNGIPDLCDPQNKDKFNCLNQRAFFNAAIQWGVIGPRRLLGGMYPVLKWCFLIGALYPVPFWLARRYVPRYTTKLNWLLHGIHEMAILTGVSWAPRSLLYEFGLVYVNVLFNYYIKSKFPMWWQKFAYPFSHAMDVGVGYSGLIVFFSTQYKNVVNLNWWGNTQPFTVGDATGMALHGVPSDRGYFGPEKGHFP